MKDVFLAFASLADTFLLTVSENGATVWTVSFTRLADVVYSVMLFMYSTFIILYTDLQRRKNLRWRNSFCFTTDVMGRLGGECWRAPVARFG